MASRYALFVYAILIGIGVLGCMPEHLKKYRKGSSTKEGYSAGSYDNSLAADASSAPPSTVGEKAQVMRAEQVRASIYALDKQTFRFLAKENDVWESALTVLLRNYNVTIVDKTTGIITTEWDSYYLNNAVYRNKISLRVTRPNRGNQVDVTLHNNVERLKDASQAASGAMGAVWQPTEDAANEVGRIVQNMAIILNQPPPVMPPNLNGKAAVARDGFEEPINLPR